MGFVEKKKIQQEVGIEVHDERIARAGYMCVGGGHGEEGKISLRKGEAREIEPAKSYKMGKPTTCHNIMVASLLCNLM